MTAGPDRLDPPEALVAGHEEAVSLGRSAVLGGVDLLVGAVHADAQHLHEDPDRLCTTSYRLVGSPQRGGQLGTFLELLAAKKPIDLAFQTAFGTTPISSKASSGADVDRPKLQVVSYTFPDLNAISARLPRRWRTPR